MSLENSSPMIRQNGGFKKKYYEEIKDKDDYKKLVKLAKEKNITLIYSSKEEVYNNATALKIFIENDLKKESRATQSRENRND